MLWGIKLSLEHSFVSVESGRIVYTILRWNGVKYSLVIDIVRGVQWRCGLRPADFFPAHIFLFPVEKFPVVKFSKNLLIPAALLPAAIIGK